MKCPNCDRENRNTAHFCQYCGASLHVSPEAAITEPPQEQPIPIELEQAADIHQEPPTEVAMPVAEEPDAVEQEQAHDVPPVEEASRPLSMKTTPDQVETDNAELEPETEPDVEETLASRPLPTEESEPSPPSPEPEELGETEMAAQETVEPQPETPAEQEPPPADGGETEPEPDMPVEPEPSVKPEPAPDQETQVDQAPVKETTPEQQEAEVDEPPLTPEEEQESLVDIVPEEQETDYEAAADLFWRKDTPSLEALSLGAVVNGRYQISEVLSIEHTEILYRVRDLQRCARCEYDGNSPDQAFCDSCGAVLDQKPQAMMLERPPDYSDAPGDITPEDHFKDQNRLYWVWREIQETAPLPNLSARMRMIVGQKSDVGQRRDLDEDSLLAMVVECTFSSLSEQIALFVVADGMGGHEGGEVASKLAIQTLAQSLFTSVFAPYLQGRDFVSEKILDWMKQAVEKANEQVYLERQKRRTDMGTTMTAVLVKDWTIHAAHVGDCRAYLWGENGLEQLTTDHSIVASMIAAGTAEPDEIYTHPQRSVIYRSIGDRPSVDVDTFTRTVEPGDRIVVCCDGLWEMIRNEGIEEVMLSESDPQTASDVMVEQANTAGGVDNISVIVVQL